MKRRRIGRGRRLTHEEFARTMGPLRPRFEPTPLMLAPLPMPLDDKWYIGGPYAPSQSDIEDRDERALRLAAGAAATDAYADVDVPLVHGRVFEPTNADPKCIKEQRPDGLTHAEKIAFGKARAEWERRFGHRIRSDR